MISYEYHWNKKLNKYEGCSYGWDSSYKEEYNILGFSRWYDTYTGKRLPKKVEKQLIKKYKHYIQRKGLYNFLSNIF